MRYKFFEEYLVFEMQKQLRCNIIVNDLQNVFKMKYPKEEFEKNYKKYLEIKKQKNLYSYNKRILFWDTNDLYNNFLKHSINIKMKSDLFLIDTNLETNKLKNEVIKKIASKKISYIATQNKYFSNVEYVRKKNKEREANKYGFLNERIIQVILTNRNNKENFIEIYLSKHVNDINTFRIFLQHKRIIDKEHVIRRLKKIVRREYLWA